MSRGPTIAVVVVTWQSGATIERCLASLRDGGAQPLELVVVDNASTDGTPGAVRASFPEAKVVETGANLGFAAACNRGAAATSAPWLLFLNPDTEVRAGALGALIARALSEPRCSAAGPLTRYPDGTPQLSFGPDLTPFTEPGQRRLVRGLRRRDPDVVSEVTRLVRESGERDWVSGACLLVRRSAFVAVGGFDDGYFLYEEDADLCRRLRDAGGRVLHVAESEVVHAVGASMAASATSRLAYHRSHLRYYRRWNGAAAALALRLRIAAEAATLGLRGRLAEARATLSVALSG